MFKKYIEYYKHNPEGYWFKRKIYGFGWVPVTWQGWLAIGIWLVLVLGLASTIDATSSAREVTLMFFLPLVILTSALIRICYAKGERPRWQWGLEEEK